MTKRRVSWQNYEALRSFFSFDTYRPSRALDGVSEIAARSAGFGTDDYLGARACRRRGSLTFRRFVASLLNALTHKSKLFRAEPIVN